MKGDLCKKFEATWQPYFGIRVRLRRSDEPIRFSEESNHITATFRANVVEAIKHN